MIYDCISFFNELDILDIRLNTLNNFVDYFVIVEAKKTHSGLTKPLYYEENKLRFKKFEKKIIHIVIEEFPVTSNPWVRENYQRNKILDALKNCDDEDVILISDADEIPNPKMIKKNIRNDNVYCFLQDMYFFYLNYIDIKHLIWQGGTKMLKYKLIKNNLLDNRFVTYNDQTFPKFLNQDCATPTKIRLYRKCILIMNGGWHFSYVGGIDAVIQKIKSFAHQEDNNENLTNRNLISRALENGEDLWASEKKRSGHKFYTVKIRFIFLISLM